MKKHLYTTLLLLLGVVTGALSQSMTITGGNDHGVIICAEGYLYAWGSNVTSTMQGPLLGIDENLPGYNDASVFKPMRVKTEGLPYSPVGGLTFHQVTAGSGAFSLALACNTIVYAWGENVGGSCGQGPNSGNIIQYPTPVLKGETPGYNLDGTEGGDYLGGVVYVAANTVSSFAILDDGRVVGWGGEQANKDPLPLLNSKGLPVYIKGPDGTTDLKNVTHITGGDHNCYFMVDEDGDGAGRLYAIGPLNGKGGTAAQLKDIETPANVTVPVVKEDGTPLDDIRMSAAADQGGYAVTGDGYLWGWGNAGWGGLTGSGTSTPHNYAKKIISGEYKTISNEEYLTDVVQVIGGRGYGAAITKEGYLVYWGVADNGKGETIDGGVAPTDNATIQKYNVNNQGVKPILAKYCDASGKPGELVKDAVSISRGDNFGFMINSKDEYYVWGKNTLGQAGTDNKTISEYNCLTKLKTIPCDPQDNCPSVFMLDRKKCPGKEIELDCGFVVPVGKEDRYFVTWKFNGTIMNSSTKASSSAERSADKYNKATILISEAGTYTVEIEYIGGNIPCDKCELATTSCVVSDMPMPIDPIETEMNCVNGDDKTTPMSSDVIKFEAVVNDAFYDANQLTTFAIFATETSTDTLAVDSAMGAGGSLKYSVTGDKIKDINKTDTIFYVWAEDITRLETSLFEKKMPSTLAETNGYNHQYYTQIIYLPSSSELQNFTLFAKSNKSSGSSEFTVTPVVYKAGSMGNSGYIMDPTPVFRGKAQSFELDYDEDVKACVVDCNFSLQANSVRGTEYVLGMEYVCAANDVILYTESLNLGNGNYFYANPRLDSKGFGIKATGSTSGLPTPPENRVNQGSINPFWNITFGKMTDYTCGRIQLPAKQGCPPCDKPDDWENILLEVDGAKRVKDTIYLCEESAESKLSVSGIKKTDVDFDVLWFLDKKGLDADALQLDEKVSASNLTKASIKWSAAKEGTVEKYIMRIRDNAHVTSSDCYVEDSIYVKYNEKPVVPTIEIPAFCQGLTDDAVRTYLSTNLTTLLTGLSADIKDPSASAVTVAGLEASFNTLPEGKNTYEITVTDDKTKCVSEPGSFDVTVKAIPDAPATENISFPVSEDVATKTVEGGVPVLPAGTLHWYSNKTDYPNNPSTTVPSVPVKDATPDGQPYVFYVSQNVDGCESDTARFNVEVNDSKKPDVRDTSICVYTDETNPNPSVDLTTLVTPGDPDLPGTTFSLNWYTDPTAAKKTGSATAPVVDYKKTGEQTFYVSQTNEDLPTKPESGKAMITVKVYKAKKLSDVPTDNYCWDEMNPSQLVQYYEEGTSYETATDLKWFLNGFEWNKAQAPEMTTNDTTYVFKGVQYYTIADQMTGAVLETCVSDTTDYVVNVSYTSPANDASIAYIAAEVGGDGVTFPALDTKDEWSEDPDYTYYYRLKGESAFTTTVPQPKCDVSTLNGNTVQYVYEVYRVKKNALKECPSKMSNITVSISDAMPPKVKDYHYCEGSTIEDLEATIQPISGKTEVNYSLYWYKNRPSNTTDAPDLKSPTYPMNGEVATVNADGTIKSTTYFVAQHDEETDATSAAVEVHVVVYPKPILLITDPAATCGSDNDFVDIEGTWVATNTSERVTATYSADVPNMVEESGTYQIHGTYNIPTTPFTGANLVEAVDETCVGNDFDVNVEVNYLTVPTIGSITTICPGKEIGLKATATSTDPGDASITYQWAGASHDAGDTTTVIASEETGFNHTFSVLATAGACSYTSSEYTVTVGDGPVTGKILFTESENEDDTYKTIKDFTGDINSRIYYSCGGGLTITSNLDKTEGEFEWFCDDTKVGTGDNITIDATTAYSDKIYTVKYVNDCETQTSFRVITVPLEVSYVGPDTTVVRCEGEVFVTQVNVKCQEITPKIHWYRGTTPLETKDANTTTVNDYSIEAVRKSDEGDYNCVVTNRGCKAMADADKLIVHPNVKAMIDEGPIIVQRHESQTLVLDISSPADGQLREISWKRDGQEVQFGGDAQYTETDVVADHEYFITLNDPDYCGTAVTTTIYVDAQLQLVANVKDTICLGESEPLTIDTTGTGLFRSNKPVELKITSDIAGITQDVSAGLKRDGNKLVLDVSPSDHASYHIRFTYGDQPGDQFRDTTLYVYVIPAISMDTPEPVTLCEGEETKLTVQNVSPQGTTVSWFKDPTILSATEDSLEVTVAPKYDSLKGEYHQYRYTYLALAYNKACGKTKEYPIYVNVDEPIKGEMEGIPVICDGFESYVDAASFDATTYSWSNSDGEQLGSETRIMQSPTHSMTYTVDMTRGTCTSKVNYVVEVKSLPVILEIDSVGYHSRDVVLETGAGEAPYMIWIDKTEDNASTATHFDNIVFGTHTMHVRDVNGCETSRIFQLDPPELTIPVYFSPNGDDIHENWIIPGVAEVYPNAVVTIFDRYGKVLVQFLGADAEGWDGTYNGNPLPATDYWYQIDIEEINRQYIGHFTLIRR